MKKIYIVTSGIYSDYGIDAVFDNKDLAQAFCDKFNRVNSWYEMGVEEWEINPNDFQTDLNPFNVVFYGATSDVKEVREASDEYWNFAKNRPQVTKEWQNLTAHVWARDKDHAIKIANEKRAQYINNQP